jgi:signal peptidase
MKFFKEFITWFFLVIYASLVLISFFLRDGNNLRGYRSFLVQSGSMEPTIMTGDVIIVKPELEYKKHNVVTFKDSSNHIITHRIMEIDNGHVVTKGDANRSIDNGNISLNQILGKVIFIIPKLGFFIVFSKSLIGLIIFIYLPVIYLIISGIISILKSHGEKLN